MKKTWAGIIGYEGMSTGDGRFIEPGALMWATLPMPLRFTSEDVGAHDGAVVSGNIKQIKRLKAQPDGSVPIWASGTFDIEGKHGKEAARLVEQKLQNGISMDLDDVSFEVRTLEMSNGEIGQDEMMVTTKARVRAATLVAIPAFEGARIYMLDDNEAAKLATKEPLKFQPRVDGLAFLKSQKVQSFAGIDSSGRWHATFPDVGNRWIDMPGAAVDKLIQKTAKDGAKRESVVAADLRAKAAVLDEAMKDGDDAQAPLDEMRDALEVFEMTDGGLSEATDEVANVVEVMDAVQRKIDDGGFTDQDEIDTGGFEGADFDEPEPEAPAEASNSDVDSARANPDLAEIGGDADQPSFMLQQTADDEDNWEGMIFQDEDGSWAYFDGDQVEGTELSLENAIASLKAGYEAHQAGLLEPDVEPSPELDAAIKAEEEGQKPLFKRVEPALAYPISSSSSFDMNEAEKELYDQIRSNIEDANWEAGWELAVEGWNGAEKKAVKVIFARLAEGFRRMLDGDAGNGDYTGLDANEDPREKRESGGDEMSVAEELVADLGDRGIELTPEQAADAIAFYGDPEAALTEILENGGWGGGPAADAPMPAVVPPGDMDADINSPAGIASELGQALTAIGEASSLDQRERMLEYGNIVSNIAADLDAGTIEPHIALLAFEMADDKLGGMGMNDNTSFLRNKLRETLEAQIDWDAVGETPSDEDIAKAAGIAGIDPETIDPDFFASKVQAFKADKGNWVEQTGGLPKYIREIADALMERNGWPEGRAIATAVNTVKRWARGGNVTSDPESPRVSAGTIAKAAAAVAEWEANRIEAKASASAGRKTFTDGMTDYLRKTGDYALADAIENYQPEERSLVASGAKRSLAAPIAPPKAWFENPRLNGPTPLTVDKDGRVYGHLATWDVCHLAMPNGANECVMAPRSTTGYSMFHLGVVETAEGTHVPVGRITMKTTHAGDNWNARKAIAHYENTGLAVADVSAGEDSYGIWIAGALRPDATPEQVRALRASPLSGDWRRHPNGNLELVMGLAVNMPGFPVPRPKGLVASGALQSLVAAGMVAPKRVEKAKVEEAKADPNSLAADDLKYLRKLAERERQIEAETLKLRVLETAVKPKIDAFAAKLREQKAKNEEES